MGRFHHRFSWDNLSAHHSHFPQRCGEASSIRFLKAHLSPEQQWQQDSHDQRRLQFHLRLIQIYIHNGHCLLLCWPGNWVITFVKYHMGDREIIDHMLFQHVYYGLFLLLQFLFAHTATCGHSGILLHIWWTHRWGRHRSIPGSPHQGSRRGPCH